MVTRRKIPKGFPTGTGNFRGAAYHASFRERRAFYERLERATDDGATLADLTAGPVMGAAAGAAG